MFTFFESGVLPTPYIFMGFFGFCLFVIWSLFWKALALFEASRKDQKVWFIALLLINTMGILEIVYLFMIAKTGIKNSALFSTPWRKAPTTTASDTKKDDSTPPTISA